MICCRIIKGTPSLKKNGHRKTSAKQCTPVSFLTHQMNHSHRGNRLVINFNKRKSSIIFPEFVYFLGKKKLRWVHCRFFIRCFQRGIVLIVILRFVVGWLRGRQARSYMAIKRLLEKAVRQSLFSLIKWITAAKATGWSSTFAIYCDIYWHESVNVLTVLSRALIRILSKHGAWVLELTCQQKIGSATDVLSL